MVKKKDARSHASPQCVNHLQLSRNPLTIAKIDQTRKEAWGGGAPRRTLQKGKAKKKRPRSRSREIAPCDRKILRLGDPTMQASFCRRPRIQPASYSAVSVRSRLLPGTTVHHVPHCPFHGDRPKTEKPRKSTADVEKAKQPEISTKNERMHASIHSLNQ